MLQRIGKHLYQIVGTTYHLELYFSGIIIGDQLEVDKAEWIAYDSTRNPKRRTCLRFDSLGDAVDFWRSYATEQSQPAAA